MREFKITNEVSNGKIEVGPNSAQVLRNVYMETISTGSMIDLSTNTGPGGFINVCHCVLLSSSRSWLTRFAFVYF